MIKQVNKAVAVKYSDGIDVPVIMAKGSGEMAKKIVTEAEKNSIFIKEDETLVDMLGLSNVGDVVPECAWKALAVIFSYILKGD